MSPKDAPESDDVMQQSGTDEATGAPFDAAEPVNLITEDNPCGFQWPGGPDTIKVNLALQGGGAHGAFTWGVLDRLLSDQRIEIDGISGTSAGAMNGAVLAAGLTRSGRDGARRALRDFWKSVSRDAAMSPIQRTGLDLMFANWSMDANPALAAFDVMTRMLSPYQFNPLNWNPLRQLLSETVDFAAVKECNAVRLFVSATNVHTGRAHIFSGRDVTVDSVMASACLPSIFQAVEIDGVPYWDGGYMGNPVLSPFFKYCSARDIIVVQVNPILREQRPTTAREIQDRINEISFNAPLIRELRHVEFINNCIQRGELSELGYRETYLHRVGGGEELRSFTASTKLNAEWAFLKLLRDIGRRSADAFIADHFEALGQRSTLNARDIGKVEHEGVAPAPAAPAEV
ncbi:MAG: patatin-like phospholipase family protein [Pseudomonadota bacterium]